MTTMTRWHSHHGLPVVLLLLIDLNLLLALSSAQYPSSSSSEDFTPPVRLALPPLVSHESSPLETTLTANSPDEELSTAPPRLTSPVEEEEVIRSTYSPPPSIYLEEKAPREVSPLFNFTSSPVVVVSTASSTTSTPSTTSASVVEAESREEKDDEEEEETLPNECRFGSSIYHVGETFYDGCAYKCVCREGGLRECKDRCPIYVDTTGFEHCDWIPSDEDTCCMVPKCPELNPTHSVEAEAEENAKSNETESSHETHGDAQSASASNGVSKEEEDPPRETVAMRPFCVHGDRVLTMGEFSAEENCVSKMCMCDVSPNGTTFMNCSSNCAQLPDESLTPTRDCPVPQLIEPTDSCLCPYVVCSNNINPLDLPVELRGKMSCDLKGRTIETGEEVYDDCRAICHCTTDQKLECAPIECPPRIPPFGIPYGPGAVNGTCAEWEIDSHFVARAPYCCPPAAKCKVFTSQMTSTTTRRPLPMNPDPRRLDDLPSHSFHNSVGPFRPASSVHSSVPSGTNYHSRHHTPSSPSLARPHPSPPTPTRLTPQEPRFNSIDHSVQAPSQRRPASPHDRDVAAVARDLNNNTDNKDVDDDDLVESRESSEATSSSSPTADTTRCASTGCERDDALRPYYIALLVLSAFATMTTFAFLCLLYSVVRRGSAAIAPISQPQPIYPDSSYDNPSYKSYDVERSIVLVKH